MNNYEKKKKLGQGSFGSAYLVEYKPTGKLYCMKKIKLSDMDSKEEKEKAKQEVEILKMFNDTYIVSYFESFLDEKQYNLHIVMEYCAGGELESLIKKYKEDGNIMKENEILHYFYQICCGLLLIHSKKILHRDLKSNNVFLDSQNNCKIGDFGISKVLQCTAQKALTAIGTPYYLSPELCQGKPYDNKSDVWALGIILYELCTYNHPFNDIPNGYSQELHDLVHLLMNKDPLQRPNCQEILNLPIMTKYMESLQTELDKKIEKAPLTKRQSQRYLLQLKKYDFLSTSSPNLFTRKTAADKIDESKLIEFTAPSGKILPTLQEFDGIEDSMKGATEAAETSTSEITMIINKEGNNNEGKDNDDDENNLNTMIIKEDNNKNNNNNINTTERRAKTPTSMSSSTFHKEARKHQSVRLPEPVSGRRPELPHYPSSFNNRNEMKTDAFGSTMYSSNQDGKETNYSGTMIIHDDYDESKTYTPVDEFTPDTTDEFGILDDTLEADMKNRIKLEALKRQLTKEIELPPADIKIDTFSIKKRILKRVGSDFYNKVSDFLKLHENVSDATLATEFGEEKLQEIKQIEQVIMFQEIQERKE